MAFKVRFTEQAAIDLDEIIRYVSDELYSPQSAEGFYKTVNKKLGLLSDNPYVFPLYHDDKLRTEGYRFIVCSSYLIFYLVDDESSVVNIARILYGKRDIPDVF